MREGFRSLQEIADKLLVYLRAREREPRMKEQELWTKIKCDINERKRRKLIYHSIYYVAAASVFLALVVSGNWYFQEKKEYTLDQFVSELKEPALNQEDVRLYLNEEKPVLVSDSNAQISYSSKGEILINKKSRIIEEIKDEQSKYDQIVVPKGKQTLLTLSDGTTVYLNAGTRVVYPRVFRLDCREIYVEGEICLNVQKNKDAPFIVKTSGFNVEVLGTRFNVKAYKDDVNGEVVLVDGSINLYDKNKKKIELKPDELVAINSGVLGEIKTVNAPDYVAWTSGTLIINNEPLEAVVKKMTHFYGISILVTPEAGRLIINGRADLQLTLEDLLFMISETAPIHCDFRENTYYITKKE